MGVIEGVVVRASDRSPVAGASLTWSRERTQSMPGGERATRLERGGTITTDEAGQFRIRGLLPGTLLISARAPGLASDAPTPVPIAIAEHVEGVEILLGQAADLRGRVVASDDATSGSVIANPERISPASNGSSHWRFWNSLAYMCRTSMLPVSGAEQLNTSEAISERPMISAMRA